MGENTSINVILKTKASKITVLRFCCFGLKLLKVFIAVEKNLNFFLQFIIQLIPLSHTYPFGILSIEISIKISINM